MSRTGDDIVVDFECLDEAARECGHRLKIAAVEGGLTAAGSGARNLDPAAGIFEEG